MHTYRERFRPVLALSAILWMGCPPAAPVVEAFPDASSDIAVDSAGPDVSGTVYVTPPEECTPPSTPADPLVLSHEVGLAYNGLHLLEIKKDLDSGIVWTVGRGGLIGLTTDGDTSAPQAKHPAGLQVFEHLEVLDNGRIAMSNRGDNTKGMEQGFWGLGFANASDPADIRNIRKLDIEDAGATARIGTTLYLVTFRGTLAVIDVTTPGQAAVTTEVEGLQTPWNIAVDHAAGAQRAYIVDNGLGVVVVDVSNPVAPVLGAQVATSGSALDLHIDHSNGAFMYVAAGSSGIDVFSLAEPDAPALVTTVDLGAAAIAVSGDSGAMWATTQQSVALLDARDPSSPLLLGLEKTPSWAMDVYSEGTRAWVADWNDVRVYDGDLDARAPDLDPSRDELYFDASGVQLVTLVNRGAAELTLTGMTSGDSRVSAGVDTLSIAPGGAGILQVTFDDDSAGATPVDTTLCIASNDPDTPTTEIAIKQASEGSSILIGEQAPDFVLPDLDGNLYTLSDFRGHPVVLVYFATW